MHQVRDEVEGRLKQCGPSRVLDHPVIACRSEVLCRSVRLAQIPVNDQACEIGHVALPIAVDGAAPGFTIPADDANGQGHDERACSYEQHCRARPSGS